jgi:hypothetical protein
VFVTLAVPLAVFYAMRGNIARHRGLMTGLYIGALIVAGGFSLSPDRLLGKTLRGALAGGMMGPPGFTDAAINVGGADLAIKINLR